MSKIRFSLFVMVGLAVFGQYCLGAPTGGDFNIEDLKTALLALPENERNEFLIKHSDFFYWITNFKPASSTKEEAELGEQSISERKSNGIVGIYMDTICLPPPVGCFDPDDPSIHPNSL